MYIKEKFSEFETPSLIKKSFYTHSKSGVLDFDKNKDYQAAREIKKKQRNRILKKIHK